MMFELTLFMFAGSAVIYLFLRVAEKRGWIEFEDKDS